MDVLAKLVATNAPPRSALARAFQAFRTIMARDLESAADELAALAAATAALAAWAATPAAERRRIANGWDIPVAFPSIEDWTQAASCLRRVLAVNHFPEGNTEASAEFELAETTLADVKVVILAGTPKAVALQALRDLEARLAAEWERWITLEEEVVEGLPGAVANAPAGPDMAIKKPRIPSPSAPNLGGRKSEAAMVAA